MRAIAACQFEISRFDVWRLCVVVFTGSVVVSLSVWWLSRPDASLGWTAAAVLALMVAALVLGRSLLRTPAASLRWDGQDWHLESLGAAPRPTASGALSVALDFGGWMLLRFQAHEGSQRPRVEWLPVQRQGLEAQWHALRCAVYSARPAAFAARDAGSAAEP